MRRFERFLSGENATLDIQGNKVNCIVRDISLGGAKILLEKKDLSIKEGQDIILNIYNVDIPAKVNRFINNENEIATKFSLDTTMRRFLIGCLFTGNYDNEIGRVSVWGAIKGITRKTFY
jgi:hypothetical protein